MRFGDAGWCINFVGDGALEAVQGVLVVFYALVEDVFAENAGLLVGDVSQGVVELSRAAET